MCATKTCEKYHFLMRKGTKIALKPKRVESNSKCKISKSV